MVTIFIHSLGQIVEKFDFDFEDFDKLVELYLYSKKKYGKAGDFCFDVMIL